MSELRELGNISLPFALDKKGNYIYIQDADRGTKYYCPCCGKEVNTIAIDEGVDYIMPPHYRHYANQSCSGESLAHWVYKMWLFDEGSQFYVSDGTNKTLYKVKSIDIEKTYITDYGDYRPDLTIITECDKTFYFELNFSNPKRGDDYFCKWSQLNNDVIEVDVKKLLKESLNNKIPTFRLIYSDGICFDDKYNKRDAFASAANKLSVRKLEIKRQDMLNYKATWERLDWFFDSIKMFRAMKSTMEEVMDSFNNVPFKEMELCFNIVKNISCINNNDGFRGIINTEFSRNIKLFIENKVSHDNYITAIKCKIEIKKGCDIKICAIHKKCNIIEFSSPIYKAFYENRKWYMGYDYYSMLTNNLNLLISNFNSYYFIIDEINKYFTWNKYPLLYDQLNFIEKINMNNQYMSRDITIDTNYECKKVINSINASYNKELLKLYKREIDRIEKQKISLIYERIVQKFIGFCFELENRSNKYIININRYTESFCCDMVINLTDNNIVIYVNNNIISEYDFMSIDDLYDITVNLIDTIVTTEFEIYKIKNEKITKQENLYEEYRNSLYVNNVLDNINTWLNCYNTSLYVSHTLGTVNFKYYSNSIIPYNGSYTNSFEIPIETFTMVVKNEILYGYIKNNISTWMTSKFIEVNNFINLISKYNNNMWEFENKGNTIEIKLKYINPVGYIKNKTSNITINIETIDENSISRIKFLLADKMHYMLNSTLEYYNKKYQDCRLIKTRRTTNA